MKSKRRAARRLALQSKTKIRSVAQQPLPPKVRLLGRRLPNGEHRWIADIHRAVAERYVLEGRAEWSEDRRVVRFTFFAGQPYRDPRALELRNYMGQSAVVRESLSRVACDCVTILSKGRTRANPDCRICHGTGVLEVDAHCMALREIDPRDGPLYRLSVTDNLSPDLKAQLRALNAPKKSNVTVIRPSRRKRIRISEPRPKEAAA